MAPILSENSPMIMNTRPKYCHLFVNRSPMMKKAAKDSRIAEIPSHAAFV